MAAGKYNFTIEQGATFVKIIVVSADGNPLNLSDYSARLMARPSRLLRPHGPTKPLWTLPTR